MLGGRGRGCWDVPLWSGMRRYGGESPEKFLNGIPLGGKFDFFADALLNLLEKLALLEATSDGDAVVELIAGELDLLAMVVVLDEADEVAGGELGIVKDFEDALRGEVAGMVMEPGGFLRRGRRCGRGRILLAAPLEDVGAVEAPDGHAGGCYSVARAEVGAGLPAVGGAGRRVIEEEKEFVEERDGLAVGVLGVLEPMEKRVKSRDFQRRCLR